MLELIPLYINEPELWNEEWNYDIADGNRGKWKWGAQFIGSTEQWFSTLFDLRQPQDLKHRNIIAGRARIPKNSLYLRLGKDGRR